MSKILFGLRSKADGLQLALINGITGSLGENLRYRFWKGRLKHLGKKVKIDPHTCFQNPEYISISDNCWIDRNVYLLAGSPGGNRVTHRISNHSFNLEAGEISIGANTHIGPNCVLSGIGGLQIGKNCGIAANSSIYSYSHHYRNLEDRNDTRQYYFTPRCAPSQQAMILGPVVIEDGCAVALNCVLLPGTTLKQGAWIECGSVLRGKIDEHTVVSDMRTHKSKKLDGFVFKEE